MKFYIQCTIMIIGAVLFSTSTFLWAGYSIYQLIATDLGFFEIVLPGIFFWVVQTILGLKMFFLAKGSMEG